MSVPTRNWWQQTLLTLDQLTVCTRNIVRGPVSRRSWQRGLELSPLEPRILFSAAPMDVAAMDSADDSAVMVAEVDPAESDSSSAAGASQNEATQAALEIVVIDSRVSDLDQLLEDLGQSERNFEVFVLDAQRDGVDQISEILGSRSNVSSLHIVSHAEDFAVRLGNVWLGSENLDGYAGQIAAWHSSLTSDADILFYGCDLASGESGRTLIDSVSTLTGADVAASDDDTGYANFGADWDLEYQSGAIETGVAFSSELQQNWVGKLSIITVDTFDDEVSANGLTSLREAIIAANAGSGGDTIVLSAGTYTLSIAGTDEDFAATGDLDIRKSVSIVGAGVGATTVDGGGLDRVFDVISGTVQFDSLTIQGGNVNAASPGNGGGIRVMDGTDVTVNNALLTGNAARNGGAIDNAGTLYLTDVTLDGNTSSQNGGGLASTGDATFLRVTVSNNIAIGTLGGGIEINRGTLIATNLTVSGNSSGSSGGGISSVRAITLQNSTITNNTSNFGSGVYLQGSGSASIRNTIIADNNTSADIQGTFTSLGNNLIGNKGTATGFIHGTNGDQVGSNGAPLDPLLGDLQDNGGATFTHALLAASTAINAGSLTGAPATDQREIARVGATDIGAYEFTSFSNSAPTDITPNSFAVNENVDSSSGYSLGILTATDPDSGESFTFSIRPGGDAPKFSIGGASGNELILTDGILDAETTSSYSVNLRVTDSVGNQYDETLLVNVNDLNDNPEITSNGGGATASINVAENHVAVTTVAATDADAPAQTLTYSINGGDDAAKFTINSSTGELSFIAAPDFETPTDVGGNNVYDVIVEVSDGTLTDSQAIAITVNDAVETGLPSDSILISTDQNVTSSGAPGLSAWDAGEVIEFGSIASLDPVAGTTSGSFASLFNLTLFAQDGAADIESLHYVTEDITIGNTTTYELQTGDVLFATRDIETLISTNTLAITRNDLIVFRPDAAGDYSSGTFTILLKNPVGLGFHAVTLVTQNTLVGDVTLSKGSFLLAHTDSLQHHKIQYYTPDNVGAISTTGTLQTLIDETSILSGQLQGLDLIENSVTLGGHTLNVGEILVSVKAGGTVGSNNVTVTGNDIFSLSVTTTDLGSAASNFTATLVLDGSDVGLDSLAEEIFGFSLTSATIPPNQAPVITSDGGATSAAVNVAENTSSVTTVTASDADLPTQSLSYSISGGDDAAKFTINSVTGVLSFIAVPDFETPTDTGGNNVYDVVVQVSDGTLTDTQAIAVTVTAVNDNAPAITSDGGGASASIDVTENTTSVTTVTATDADMPAPTLTYSISGTDAAKFTINSSSGELSFIAPPNYEAPGDAGGSNIYYITVQASDGTLTDTQALAVTVTDASEALTPSNEFLVNDQTGDQQITSAEDRGNQQAVSMAADGSYVVVWTSLNQDGSGKGVYAQRFAATGSAITAEFRVNQTTTNDQQWASVASAFDGTFVVTWTSNQGATGQDVYYRRFAANGTALTNELVANTTTSGNQKNSIIGMNSLTGEFVIAWQGNGEQSGEVDANGIFAQRFDATGATVGGEFRVNNNTSGSQYDAAIAVNTDGDFVIAWDDTVGVHFQRFDDDGNEQGGQETVVSSLYAGNSAVAMHSDGSFVVVWRQSGFAAPSDVYLQRYSNTGTTVGSTQIVAETSSFDQSDPSIAMDDDGKFIVVWEGYGAKAGHSDSSGVFGQKYQSNGAKIGNEFRVNESTTGTQSKASLAMLDVDEFVVVWSGNGDQTGQVDSSGVFARQYGTTAINAAPTVTLTNKLASLAENADTTSSIKISDIVISDDGNGTNVLSLSGDDAAMFEIVGGNELHLKAGVTLDFETNPSLDVTVHIDDAQIGVTFEDTDSLAIAISDINEAPTVTLTPVVTTLAENADTTSAIIVATITVSDDALGTNSLSLSGNDAALFEIVGNDLRLVAGATLDFETNASLDVTVNVDDTAISGSPEDSANHAISISDINDAPTVTLTPVVTTLAENADTTSAITVATITVNDDALGTNSLSLSGDDAALFEIVGNDLRLIAGASLDFETNASLDVTVNVDDAAITGSPDDSANYAVSISDINEAPTITLTPVVTTLAENADTTSAITVATITVSDDALGTNSLSLSGDDASLFEIVGNDLRLIAGATLDFETNPSLDVTVNVDDTAITGSPEDSANHAVSISNINDAPTVTLTPVVTTLGENTDTSSGSIKVADITITDDGTGTNVLSLTGDDAAMFEIVGGNELHLKSGVTLDFETNPSLDVSVNVDDSAIPGSPDDAATYSVSITDQNDAPAIGGTANKTMNDNATAVIFSTVTIGDIDGDNVSITVSLSNGDANGSFTAASLLASGFTADGNGVYSRTASSAALAETAIRQLVFDPTENQAAVNTATSTTITITVNDSNTTKSKDIVVNATSINDDATGNPVIVGVAAQGQTLTADTSGIADADGLGSFVYEWTRNGSVIAGATSSTYTLSAADVGRAMRVSVSFTDALGSNEGPLLSTATASVVGVNTVPVMTNTQVNAISGQRTEFAAAVFQRNSVDIDGDPLTAVLVTPPASGSLSLDPNGRFVFTSDSGFTGTISFQWKANDGASDSNVATVVINVLPAAIPLPLPPVKNTPDPEDNRNDDANDDSSDSDSDNASDNDATNVANIGLAGMQSEQSGNADAGNTNNNVVEFLQLDDDESQEIAVFSVQTTSQINTESDSGDEGTYRSDGSVTTKLQTANSEFGESAFQAISVADYALLTSPGQMWDQLDNYQKQLDSQIQGDLIMVGTAGAAASSFTVGIVAWALRSGFLVSGLLAHMPAWRAVDPLLIMQGMGANDDGESLEELMDRRNQEMDE